MRQKKGGRKASLTQNLQLDDFINASLEGFVSALTGDFHAIHVLRDVELHLGGGDLSAPKARLVADATLAR